jgi:phosphate/phosphite/phosphonate ABC transporter binding protein
MNRLACALLLPLAACRAPVPEPVEVLEPASEAGRPASTPLPGSGREVRVPKPLRVGILPVFSAEELAESYAPFLSYLGEALSTEVELRVSEDYRSMVDQVANGAVDLVQLAPVAYVLAKERAPDLDLLATNISEGSSSYSSYIVARTDSTIETADDLRGKRFGFVDRDSTSGYVYPYAFLIEQGIDPERDFGAVVMTRRHDLAVEALLRGEIDAAATFSGALLNAASRGEPVERLKIVAKTGRVPYDAWCARGDLDPLVRARLRAALLGLSTRTPRGRAILGPLQPMNAFAPATDAAFGETRKRRAMLDQVRHR